jgi:hypothetical protein
MVERGGGFNAGGATHWEWFELANVDEANVTIVWQGIGPSGSEA